MFTTLALAANATVSASESASFATVFTTVVAALAGGSLPLNLALLAFREFFIF